MIMALDGELLSRYSDDKSEEAFAELVRRHVDLVYSAALRQVNGDAHLAQDVAQMVFTELSRKAAQLSHRAVLTGWLYTCAHFCATKAVRTERRRAAREQEVHSMHEIPSAPAPNPEMDWEKVLPVLDHVMIQLTETDREAIIMRYFENRQLADIGERLGLSEDAARKRVDRALEKLRSFLSTRGITTTASLAAALSANAVQTAPAGLAAALTTASLGATAAGAGTTVTLLKLMTMTKLQIGIIGAVIVGGVATPLIIEYQSRAKLRDARAALKRENDQLAQQAAENSRLSNLLAQANAAQQLTTGEAGELLRLRGEVGNLRRQTNDLAKMLADNQRLRSMLTKAAKSALEQSTTPQESIPRDSWAFSGYANPESAFQSAIWAMSTGDAKTFVAGLSPQGREFQHAQSKSEAELAKANKDELEKVTAYRIVEKEAVSENEVILTVYAQGENATTRFKLQRIGNEWKVAGPVKGDGSDAK